MYHKQKKEIKGYKLPPVWCAQICGNSMNELCIMECAPKRNAMHFDPRKGLRLPDLPYFPEYDWNNNMASIERQVCAGFYLARAIDYLQRRRQYEPPIRANHDRQRTRRIPAPLQISGDGSLQVCTLHPNGQESQDTDNEPVEVVEEAEE